MANIIEELNGIYQQLLSFTDEAIKDDAIKSLDILEASANEVGKSWSGSWLGYQSLVYYKNYQVVPAGAHFSSEWGFYLNVMQDTQGEWEEYQFDDVINHIKTKSGNPDMNQTSSISKEGQDLFEEKFKELLSIIQTYLFHQKDPYMESLSKEVEEIKISTKSDWINKNRPYAYASRDSLATSQGFWIPPHKEIIAEVYGIRNPIIACKDLAKKIKIISSHIERQQKNIQVIQKVGTKIFIGHGRSLIWKDLKDFIQDRLGLPWDEYNRVPIAGITNISRLLEMLDNSMIAFLIMTAEDEQADGNKRARMNVIHEAGLFQGRLGFNRAIILLEEGCEEFSNIEGLGQIRFPQANLKGAFEDIRLIIEREGLINL